MGQVEVRVGKPEDEFQDLLQMVKSLIVRLTVHTTPYFI